MNVGPSDIIQGLRALAWIWQNGFVPENSRDVRYENFRRDVQDFHAVLQDLGSALANAEHRYRQRGASRAHNPRDASFEQERRRLVGAFELTLQECKDVLTRHKIAPQRNAQRVLQNLRWAAGTEDTVNELRRRLQFHSQKMLLVINRLSLSLMTDSADRLDDILGLSEQSIVLHERTQAMLRETYTLLAAYVQGRVPTSIARRPAEPPPIPAKLAQTFEDMLRTNAPLTFVQAEYDVRELPIEETFNALMIHFAGSVDAAAGSQTPEHYTQLLKAIWLVGLLQASQDFHNARPGYYYRRAINQVEQQLLERVRDPRLVSFPVEMLGALSDETYGIWPSPEPIISSSELDAEPAEREEVRLDLALQGDFTEQRIAVFRRSEHRFRIVRENVREGNVRTEQQISLSFDMTRDHFIPWYSLPARNQPAHEIAIMNQASGDLKSYRFRSSGDLYRFQDVLLGQRMVFEDGSVTFHLGNDTCGTGRFQIWQEPVTSTPFLNGRNNSASSSPAISPASLHSSYIGSAAGSVAPSTIFERPEGMEGGTVPLPALVIFTKLQDKVAYIYVKLDHGLRIFPEHCECHRGEAGYANCKVLSLARDRRGKFPVYVKYAGTDEQGQTIVSSCDLSVFRLPTHPAFRELRPKIIDKLLMTFHTPIRKDAFNVELHERFALRDHMLKQHEDYDYAMLRGAERPRRTTANRAPLGYSLTRTASFAPSVGSLQLGESFADGVARGTDPAPSRSARQADASFHDRRLSRTDTEGTIRPARQNGHWTIISQPTRSQSNSAGQDSRQSSTSSVMRNFFRSSR